MLFATGIQAAFLVAIVQSSPCPYAKRSSVVVEQSDITQPASAQLAQVWSQIESAGDVPDGVYTYNNLNLIFESMSPSVDTKSDILPNKRTKAVHAAGAVVQASFKAVPNPYTGAFQGTESALIRFSLAIQPTAGSSSIVPGAAIKFFRQNQASANIFAMLSLSGQNDLNLFANTWSNHITGNNAGITGFVGSLKFGTVSHWPGFTGASEAAEFDFNGNAATPSNYPFQLLYKPRPEAYNAVQINGIPNTKNTDAYAALTALQVIPAGTPLWDVYAAAQPVATGSPTFSLIGTLVSESKVTLSPYGNEDLFFKHNTFELDTVAGSVGAGWPQICPDKSSCDTCHTSTVYSCIFA